MEDFRPKLLAKSTMARKAADAAIDATKTALVEMARKHGRTVLHQRPQLGDLFHRELHDDGSNHTRSSNADGITRH
ncbi:hypothetical protein SCWH03_41680 [Streptomyces pacificus]|uniref:Transposase n=1 Tax=Streptomyces pacificus TaxID=2705029 RepID=A0A6A0AZN0_9ACTN|nr:hypothetical protein SCWH03_41680 [Streptomyces pacificus]